MRPVRSHFTSTTWRTRHRYRSLVLDDTKLESSIGSLAQHLAGGDSLVTALRRADAAYPSATLRSIILGIDSGLTIAQSCRQVLASETASSDHALVVHVIRLVAEHGGEPLAQITALEATLRDRRHARDERLSQASTALASIRFLTVVPIVCGVWVCIDDESVRRVLLGSSLGFVCLVVGLALNLAGRRWTRRLLVVT